MNMMNGLFLSPVAMEQTARQCAKKYGTPLFMYNKDRLEESYTLLRQSLPKELVIYYSMKANPNPRIIRFMLEAGSPLEVASAGEYRKALQAGAEAHSIVFTGPGKSRAELEECIAGGVYAVNAESEQEIRIIGEIAASQGKKTSVLLRVNLHVSRHGSRMASGGYASPFGIDEDQLPGVIATIMSIPSIQLIGLHTYLGTQNFNIEFYRESIALMFKLCRRIKDEYRLPLHTLGLGGGFGVPAFAGDHPFAVEEFGRIAGEQIAENRDLGLERIFIESGRFLTAEMGTYITSVLYVKQSYGRRFAILDGGTHHRAFSTLMGRSFKQTLPVTVLPVSGGSYQEGGSAGTEVYTLAGKLCTPSDVLHSGAQLRAGLAEGDLILFPSAGAYGLSCGNVHFLSHGIPREILVSGRDGEKREDISWLG
ncbi:MAG: btrK [Paenibacillaceae bacterium]|nr:btrK [Paenibacillaceae bacterium]